MFRILSLDGGGINGGDSEAVSPSLEQDTGKAAVETQWIEAALRSGGFITFGQQRKTGSKC